MPQVTDVEQDTASFMKIHHLHNWDVTYQEAVRVQQHLKEQLILSDTNVPQEVRLVAGADISYSRGDNRFFAAVILMDITSMEIIEKSSFSQLVNFPYIPGLLTFREGPPLLQAFAGLKRVPDVVIFDGHGIAHPRGIGLASHMGLFLDIPTIGCAKKRLIGTHREPGNAVGDYSELIHDGRVIGAVLRTRKNVKPVFVSQGHKIALETALAIAHATCTGFRIVEPVRRAHHEVNHIRIEHLAADHSLLK